MKKDRYLIGFSCTEDGSEAAYCVWDNNKNAPTWSSSNRFKVMLVLFLAKIFRVKVIIESNKTTNIPFRKTTNSSYDGVKLVSEFMEDEAINHNTRSLTEKQMRDLWTEAAIKTQ